MRTGTRSMALLLLVGLAACDEAPRPDAAIAQAEAVPAAVASPPVEPSTSVADAGLAIAVARETADRAVREQTLRVQKQLRDQAQERKRARDAIERGDGNTRCLDGQKMRRVANGWEQAGLC